MNGIAALEQACRRLMRPASGGGAPSAAPREFVDGVWRRIGQVSRPASVAAPAIRRAAPPVAALGAAGGGTALICHATGWPGPAEGGAKAATPDALPVLSDLDGLMATGPSLFSAAPLVMPTGGIGEVGLSPGGDPPDAVAVPEPSMLLVFVAVMALVSLRRLVRPG